MERLREHIQTEHEGRVLKCDLCPATFTTYHHLKSHKVIEHTTDEKYACKHCGERFRDVIRRRIHEKKHEEPQFQCSYCAKRLKSEDNLLAHERYHTGEKPFSCSMCDAAFTNRNGINQHERGVHKIATRGGKIGWVYGKKKKSQDMVEDNRQR